jgi:ubiquinone/menaquinone biosynthesis C-methylase UbiE
MSTGTTTGQTPSFALAAPLDWFQLRALLWEGIESTTEWREMPAFLVDRCPHSAAVDAATCRDAYERVALAFARPDSARPSGPGLWTQLLYSSIHHLFPRTPVFMNLGFLGEVPGLSLEPHDQALYPFVALYRAALEGVAVRGRDVIDIGCGTGGGCSHLRRYLKPRSVIGVDFVDDNITAAQRLFGEEGLHFIAADAERVPLSDESADVVVSVESSHCYRSCPAFLAEVRRLLRSGGTFVLADHRPLGPEWGDGRTFDDLVRDLSASALELVKQRDITREVAASCEMLAEFKEQMLHDAPLSEPDRAHLREILHCRGSHNYDCLASGRWRYSTFVLRKP